MISITLETLAERLAALAYGEQFIFFATEEGDSYGATRLNMFEADMIIINYFGGGNPFIIDTEWMPSKDVVPCILHGLMQYQGYNDIGSFYVNEPDDDLYVPETLPDHTLIPTQEEGDRHAQAMIDGRGYYLQQLVNIDHARCPKLSVIQQFLMDSDADDRLIVKLHSYYDHRFGINPVWRYPFCDGHDLGGVILPVQEGFAMLTYSTMNSEDREIYWPEKMYLINAECAEIFASDLASYAASMAGVFQVIRDWDIRHGADKAEERSK